MIKKLVEEKKTQAGLILKLEKKIATLELESSRMERLSQTLQLNLDKDRSSQLINTRRFVTDESDLVVIPEKQTWGLNEPKLTGVPRFTIEGSNERLDTSTIKENPFEVVDPKTQKSIMNMACSPMISFVSGGATSMHDALPADIQSPRLPDKKITSIKLLEEFIIVGISPEIKENLRNFPTHSSVEFRPKLLFSYPESEVS